MVIKNKKGWTEVLEVFFSILLLAGVLTIIINMNSHQTNSKFENIYKEESLVLKEIQLNNSLRSEILNSPLGYVTGNINQTINKKMPSYLECLGKICVLNSECIADDLPEKEVYAKRVLITSDLNKYEERELKLFCWER